MATEIVDSSKSASPSSSLGKKEKKKLKKLRNRVFKVQNEGERSGLLTPHEWEEFQRLDQGSSVVGPAIRIRRRKEGIKVEGAQQRDLLAWLLKQILFPEKNEAPISRKRKREENQKETIHTVSLPHWVSVHNPGMINSLTALEIHLPESASLKLDRLESFLESNQTSHHHSKIFTKWFQGHTPRSVSDSLLYFNTKSNKAIKTENVPRSTDKLLAELENMLVQPHEWEQNGYPMSVEVSEPNKHRYPSLITTEAIDLISITLDDATALVEKIGARVEGQEENDEQLYVSTLTESQSEHPPRVFGMDCEMVRTSVGAELARITMVQFQTFEDGTMNSTTVLDELVKPKNTILDYLTRHSGMTPKLLEPVVTRLEQIQVALLRYLRPNDILVGHSLENDLKATHLIHPRVIDTALLFRASNKRTKFSLKHLSAYLLQKKIQGGSHCSEEDASIALELAIRRASFGESFHVPSGDQRRSLFEGLSKARIMCAGPPEWLQSHITNNPSGIHALGYDEIGECKKAILAWQSSKQKKTDLIYAQMSIQEKGENGSTEALDDAIIEIIQKMPPTSVLLISLQPKHHDAKKLLKQKRICKDRRATVVWSIEQEENLQNMVNDCRYGVVYWVGGASNSEDAATKKD